MSSAVCPLPNAFALPWGGDHANGVADLTGQDAPAVTHVEPAIRLVGAGNFV